MVGKIMLASTAIKRLVEPEEVASLVGWLAGPDAGDGDRRLVHDGRRVDGAVSEPAYKRFTVPVADDNDLAVGARRK